MSLERVLGRVERYKSLLEQNKDLQTTQTGLALLEDFFRNDALNCHKETDIVLILNGCLKVAYILSDYLTDQNVMTYTPPTCYSGKHIRKEVFEGTPMPERRILMFDSDMLSGDTARHTAMRLEKKGYAREKMFIYLHLGLTGHHGQPELKQIDDMLAYQEEYWREMCAKPCKPGASNLVLPSPL
jgi:hypothetical protein